MGSNVLLFGWDRPVPGRERLSVQHYDDFVKYLTTLQRRSVIQSFELILLDPHGGGVNGFFLIRGESPALDTLVTTSDWQAHTMRASVNFMKFSAVRGVTGAGASDRLMLWNKLLPD